MSVQSTNDQLMMQVYLKKAKNLKEAMFAKTPWVLQDYVMPWTAVLFYLWWDTTGMEICLFSNDYKNEEGITAAYRFFEDHTRWIYSKVVIPGCDKWTMQRTFLHWGGRVKDYAGPETTWFDNSLGDLPCFYKPKKYNVQDLLNKAERHAEDCDYAYLMPFIHEMVQTYSATRW